MDSGDRSRASASRILGEEDLTADKIGRATAAALLHSMLGGSSDRILRSTVPVGGGHSLVVDMPNHHAA
jgi:hypothetical protein